MHCSHLRPIFNLCVQCPQCTYHYRNSELLFLVLEAIWKSSVLMELLSNVLRAAYRSHGRNCCELLTPQLGDVESCPPLHPRSATRLAAESCRTTCLWKKRSRNNALPWGREPAVLTVPSLKRWTKSRPCLTIFLILSKISALTTPCGWGPTSTPVRRWREIIKRAVIHHA